jgi:uncharacterized protein (UPF0218 family)
VQNADEMLSGQVRVAVKGDENLWSLPIVIMKTESMAVGELKTRMTGIGNLNKGLRRK